MLGKWYSRLFYVHCIHMFSSIGYSDASATVLPPLLVSTVVQVINQPIVRSTVTLQDPKYNLPNVMASMRQIYSTHGIKGLWHGTSAAVLKTVPKYCTAIVVKDWMEEFLQQPDPASSTYETDRLWRSAIKSCAAGVAGAALTVSQSFRHLSPCHAFCTLFR